MRPSPKLSQMLTLQQVADVLSVHPRTVRRRIKDGALHAHVMGGVIRVSEEDLEIYLAHARR